MQRSRPIRVTFWRITLYSSRSIQGVDNPRRDYRRGEPRLDAPPNFNTKSSILFTVFAMIVVERWNDLWIIKGDSSKVFRMRDKTTWINQELSGRDVNKGKLVFKFIRLNKSFYYYSFIFIIIELKKFINDERFYCINNNPRSVTLEVIKIEGSEMCHKISILIEYKKNLNYLIECR